MELTKDSFDGRKYSYLNRENSELYDKVKDSNDPKDKEIKRLILELATRCRGAHVSTNR